MEKTLRKRRKQTVRRVLVTGGLGSLGGYVAAELLHNGYEVTLFDRKTHADRVREFDGKKRSRQQCRASTEQHLRSLEDASWWRIIDLLGLDGGKRSDQDRERLTLEMMQPWAERIYSTQWQVADGGRDVAQAIRDLGAESCAQGDLSDYDSVKKAVEGHDAVCHIGAALHAIPNLITFNANYGGTIHVLQAALECKVKKVVLASSIVAYGYWDFWEEKGLALPAVLPIREEPTNVTPRAMYSLSKLAGEQLAQAYHEESGVAVTCLRLCHITPTMKGPGNLHCQVYWAMGAITDTARAFRRGVEADAAFGIYNIGSRHRYTRNGSIEPPEDIIEGVERLIRYHTVNGRKPKIAVDPEYVSQSLSTLCIEKAVNEIGYDPKY